MSVTWVIIIKTYPILPGKISWVLCYPKSVEGCKSSVMKKSNRGRLWQRNRMDTLGNEMRKGNGISLVAQRLGLWAPSPGAPGSIPGQGARSHRSQWRCGAAKQIFKRKKLKGKKEHWYLQESTVSTEIRKGHYKDNKTKNLLKIKTFS